MCLEHSSSAPGNTPGLACTMSRVTLHLGNHSTISYCCSGKYFPSSAESLSQSAVTSQSPRKTPKTTEIVRRLQPTIQEKAWEGITELFTMKLCNLACHGKRWDRHTYDMGSGTIYSIKVKRPKKLH